MRRRPCGPAIVTTSDPNSAKPSANAALRVTVKMPFAATSWWRGTRRGIIAASAGEKNVDAVETTMLSRYSSTSWSLAEDHRGDRHAPQHVRDDEHDPRVEAVDVDAGEGGEEDRRHEERQDQGADGGVGVRSSRRR